MVATQTESRQLLALGVRSWVLLKGSGSQNQWRRMKDSQNRELLTLAGYQRPLYRVSRVGLGHCLTSRMATYC